MAVRKPLRQQIRYVKAADGTRLAWAQAGEGPVIVKAANWLTHLEYEWESPVWQHWLHFFAGNFRFVRYDERGCGMSEWREGELSARVWTDDLEAVIDAAEPKEPVTLLGISQGAVASIGYALRHPERVSRLILYGGYARGPFQRGNPEARGDLPRRDRACARGLGQRQPELPAGVHLAVHPRRDARAARLVQRPVPQDDARRGRGEAAQLARHHRHRVAARRRCACRRWCCTRATTGSCRSRKAGCSPSAIPGAEFIELDSRNHILLEEEPAWRRFQEAVLDWMRPGQRPAQACSGRCPPASGRSLP